MHRQPPSRSILVAALLLATSATIADASPRRGKAAEMPTPISATQRDSNFQRGITENGYTLGTQLPDGSFESLTSLWNEDPDMKSNFDCGTWIGNWFTPIFFFPKAPDGNNTFWAGGGCFDLSDNFYPHGGNVSQTVTVPADTPILVFWALVERDAPDDTPGSDVAYATYDGDGVWSLDVSTGANDTTLDGGVNFCFLPVRIDLSSYAGQTKTLEVGMTRSVNDDVANVVFDDFRWADLIFADSFECGGPEFWSNVHN